MFHNMVKVNIMSTAKRSSLLLYSITASVITLYTYQQTLKNGQLSRCRSPDFATVLF